MAVYPLLFGRVHVPDDVDRRRPLPRLEPEDERPARLTVRVPAALKARVEASAALEGVPATEWVARALARSVDPRLNTP